jgi:hypothetical protein
MDGAPTIPSSLEAQGLQALLNVLNSATSPDVLQAQTILLRRLALEGDVVGSRSPAPANITEIGGYINLLTALGYTDMRLQVLAGILGVAGPVSPAGLVPSGAGVTWVTLPNDRPAGPAQGTIPVTFQTRSDFAPALKLALQGLHDQGCALPLLAPVQTLPTTSTAVPADLLPLIGRTLFLVPGTALQNPDSDPLAVAQLNAGPWQIVARSLSAGPVKVTPAQWVALLCTATSCTQVPSPAAGRQYVPLAPVMASAGFVPAVPTYMPSSLTDIGWARFNNVTGLVPGVTTLGGELSLLWSPTDIAASALSGMTGNVWNGAAFVASGS